MKAHGERECAALSPDAEVRTAADRDARSGTLVEVFGTYEEVASGKAPDAPKDGHAAVRLDDGSLVHLQPPWHPDAARPADELARYNRQARRREGHALRGVPATARRPRLRQGAVSVMDIVVMDRNAYDALQSGVLE